MKIGVDAGALSIRDERLKGGVYQITLHLLEQLSQIDKHNHYYLYSFAAIDRQILRGLGPQMHNVILKPAMMWMSARLPFHLLLQPVDVFLGLSQALPATHAYTIGFVYDQAYLHLPWAYPGSVKRLRHQTTKLVNRAKKIITISQSSKADLRRVYGGNIPDIQVSYLGVDPIFKPTGPRYKGANPYFLFVGSLKRGKNIPTAIRGFSRFLRNSKNTYDFLFVGGDYWRDPEIDRIIKDSHLANRLHFIGQISHQKLPYFYRGAVAFVSPSLWEGFCMPAAEAMACGCPVITSNAGALPEVVGKAGILLDATDVTGLAAALKRLCANPSDRMELVKSGLIQSQQYSWTQFAHTVLDSYPQVKE